MHEHAARRDRRDLERGRDRRERRERREIGPSADAIGEALSQVEECDVTSTPPVSALKTLRDAGLDGPITVGERTLRAFRIADGKPRHGEMRSDDHISRYVVDFDELSEPCPECDKFGERRFRYRANHHIAGSWSLWCKRCEEKLDGEDWG